MGESLDEILAPYDVLLAGKRLDLSMPYEDICKVRAEDDRKLLENVRVQMRVGLARVIVGRQHRSLPVALRDPLASVGASGSNAFVDKHLSELGQPPDFCLWASFQQVRTSLTAQRRSSTIWQVVVPMLHKLSDSVVESICIGVRHAWSILRRLLRVRKLRELFAHRAVRTYCPRYISSILAEAHNEPYSIDDGRTKLL